MPLVYSFVARQTTVLAEHAIESGNFATVALECLNRVNNNQSQNKFTFTIDGFTFNFLVYEGYTFLVVADEAQGRTIPNGFLDKIKDEFTQKFGERGKTAIAHSLDKSFGVRLRQQMEYCQQNPGEFSKIQAVKDQVSNVKNLMYENIQKVIARGERLDDVANSASQLENEATKFVKQGRKIRSQMWWQNMKIKLVVIGVIIIVVVIIILAIVFSVKNQFKS